VRHESQFRAPGALLGLTHDGISKGDAPDLCLATGLFTGAIRKFAKVTSKPIVVGHIAKVVI
jgi:hypothetical protein